MKSKSDGSEFLPTLSRPYNIARLGDSRVRFGKRKIRPKERRQLPTHAQCNQVIEPVMVTAKLTANRFLTFSFTINKTTAHLR